MQACRSSSAGEFTISELLGTLIVRDVLRGREYEEVVEMIFQLSELRLLESLNSNVKLSISIALVGAERRGY